MSTEKPIFPSDKADKFVVRFPDGMRDKISEAAKTSGRSMNAEIIARLEQSFGKVTTAEGDAIRAVFEERFDVLAKQLRQQIELATKK